MKLCPFIDELQLQNIGRTYFFFQNCMGIVYTVYMEGLGVSMETLIGNMVGYVQVSPPGGLQVSVASCSLHSHRDD